MSPWFGTDGYRAFSTDDAKVSISLKNRGSQPSGCHATDAASIPLQIDPYLMGPTGSGRWFSPLQHLNDAVDSRPDQRGGASADGDYTNRALVRELQIVVAIHFEQGARYVLVGVSA